MKLEEGKKYVDRRGRVFGPMIAATDCLFGESKDDRGWYINGYRLSLRDPRESDLIAEHVEICPMCDNPCVPGGVACKDCGEFAVEYAGCQWNGSPNDWVTQDMVPFREGIDQNRWVIKNGIVTDWHKNLLTGFNLYHGSVDQDGDRYEIRCRRKDLPASAALPLPERTPITLWVPERGIQEGGDWPIRASFGNAPPTGVGSWVKVISGPDGFFVEGEA